MNGGNIVQIAIFVALCAGGLPAEEIGIRAPEGFDVTLYADDDLAHDINSMTIDSQGRVVVAGQGYVKILHDTDDDGRADKATLFSEFPKSGAHGMVFLENDLIATGDNMLMRLKDENADGIADGRPLPLAIVQSPEHGANGLVQGPDGWIYMICGNDGGIGSQFVRTDTSPVKKPQVGAVVRFSPDFKTSEIFAHGFRNPYDLAFNESGHLFTVDADGERDQYLPWYTPTRLFDIQQGMHHGWVQRGWTRSWNRPECFFDNVERLVEIGRGSPTGVECYRHSAFPPHYRGGIYSCCWTLGTVYYFPLTPDGASYKSEKEIFLQTTGDVGFAPVDLVVGPAGDMFIAIGGRGTRGSVFRVRYTGEIQKEEQTPEPKDDLDRVLNAPQPLAVWSRAKWMPLVEKMGKESFLAVVVNDKFSVSQRVRAMEILKEQFAGLPLHIDRDIFRHVNDRLSARAVWALTDTPPHKASETLDDQIFREFGRHHLFATSPGGAPERTVWEVLASRRGIDQLTVRSLTGFNGRRPQSARLLALSALEEAGEIENISELASVREEAMRLALRNHLDPTYFRAILKLMPTVEPKFQREETDDDCEAPIELPEPLQVGERTPTLRRDVDPPLALSEFLSRADEERQLPVDRAPLREDDSDRSRRSQLQLIDVRLLQLCLGDVRVLPSKPDVYAGYVANAPDKVDEANRQQAAKVLADLFPTNSHDLNRELARTMGMLEVECDAVAGFAGKLTHCWDLKSSVQDDIHYLIVLSRLPSKRTEEMTERTADVLSFLHMKMLLGDMYPSRNWPLRVGEAFVELCRHDPKLAEALATHRDFGMAQHAMFAQLMPEKERKLAARRMLEKALRIGDDAAWTAEMVTLFAELGDDKADAAIRDQWHKFGLRDAIISALYRNPQPQDRKLFVEALRETNAATVAHAAEALTGIGQEGSPEEIAAALSALRHQSADEGARETRQAIGESLKILANQEFSFPEESKDNTLAAYKPAFDWFSENHPEEAARLNRLADLDEVDWSARLTKIDFTQGEPDRGEKLYESRSCAKCHSGRNRLGPALEGVTGRWAREDLIKEIVDPNRNVAPQFLTSRLETRDGKVYQGMPIYESPDGTLLQTGPNETIRIAGPEVVSIAKSRTSLMPTGLLRDVSDQDVADLYAYLKTLTVKPQ